MSIEEIADTVVNRLGNSKKGFIIKDFVQENPYNVLDLFLVGKNFDYYFLNKLVRRAGESVSYKIRPIAASFEEAKQYIPDHTKILLVRSAGDKF